MRIDVLGPVEASVAGRPAALGGSRPRALLAVLALTPGRVVSSDRLIDELWGQAPPARARASLQMHVSRLRKALGGDAPRLAARAGGYVLELEPGARDLDRWEAALARARRARADGQPEAALAAIEDGLRLWRGAPLGGAGAHDLLGGERARLEEERLAAIVEGIELELELGRHDELPGRLESLVRAHPFKERLVELQMLALYRGGRQADALAAFRAARARFADELGIEPGEALRRLHEDVLRNGGSLDAAAGERRSPAPPNRTIGRARELEAIGARLRLESVRLVTLTGPGGVGKTRLALEVTRAVEPDFADGACFVSLAGLQRADDVPATIARALGALVRSGESPGTAIRRFLGAKHLLLVVDNFEHVLGAAPFVGGLLAGCRALTVLATSREPLVLQAEERHPVAALATDDAIALFHDRARGTGFAVDDAASVADIARHLDGLPLAIELAAARCAVLSAAEIAERLDASLAALGSGPRDAPARQRTLRATLDWSHELLSDEEQAAFARFAAFAGGATVDAAEAVTGASLDVLARLVAKSLLVRGGAPTRLGMLDTIRAYAAQRLPPATREAHCHHYLALARRHGSEPALWGADGRGHLAVLDAEIENLHAALGWATEGADAELALGLAAALGGYWLMRDRHADAVGWVDRAVALPGADPGLRFGALRTKCICLWRVGRAAEQPGVLAELDAIAAGDPALLSQVLRLRADHELDAERLAAADALADEALEWATVAGDAWGIAEASRRKAIASPGIGELRERVQSAAALLTAAGNVYGRANLLTSAAYAALVLGSERDALALAARA